MSLADAIEADRRGLVQQAAAFYEEVLITRERPLDAFLNLAVLYWQATDYGFATAKALSSKFIDQASARVPTLLAEAERAFPMNPEVRFWPRYSRWPDLGDEFPVEDCKQLLGEATAT